MKPFRFYLAGPCQVNRVNLAKEGVRNKLISYAYPEQLKQWVSFLKRDQQGSLMLDSGAFSAWNKGKEINLVSYIDYAHMVCETMKKFPYQTTYIVNLDVIPGKAGHTRMLSKIYDLANKAVIDNAAQEGLKNLKRMIKEGFQPIHVFHQGEDWKWLEQMIEYTSYVGISPAGDLPSIIRNRWMRAVFDYIDKRNITVDTHGFGVTNSAILTELPWTSADTVSWRSVAALGKINLPRGGYKKQDRSKAPLRCHVSERKVGKGVGHMSPVFLRMLEKEGYEYDDLQTFWGRVRVNIRYYLEMEAYINKLRHGKGIKPTKRIKGLLF